MSTADGRAPEHWVEGDDFKDLHRGDADFLGDPCHVGVRDVPAILLDEVQERHRRTSLLWVLSDNRVGLGKGLGLE